MHKQSYDHSSKNTNHFGQAVIMNLACMLATYINRDDYSVGIVEYI